MRFCSSAYSLVYGWLCVCGLSIEFISSSKDSLLTDAIIHLYVVMFCAQIDTGLVFCRQDVFAWLNVLQNYNYSTRRLHI